MAEELQSPVTQLLLDASQGNRRAVDELTPLVYQQLRRLAASKMRHEPRGKHAAAHRASP